jgi:hypothetical protein
MTEGAQRILGTFDLRPVVTAAGAKPDELMTDYRTLPSGSRARIYLPAVAAVDIVRAAVLIQGVRPFTAIDQHTVECAARGIAYLPIPPSSGNLAGLIDVELPTRIEIGGRLTVAVSQITNARAEIGSGRRDVGVARSDRPRVKTIAWRKAVGVFQLAVKVQSEAETRPLIAQKLSILRWIFASMSRNSRWHPVFVRYLMALENQLIALGGKPDEIVPSPNGQKRPEH